MAVENSCLPYESKERKRAALYRGVLRYFPSAIVLVAEASVAGQKHLDDKGDLAHDRTKSVDHGDCILRHMINMDEGDGIDENGVPHVAYVAWRALALAQEWAEKNGWPTAPAAIGGVEPLPGMNTLFGKDCTK